MFRKLLLSLALLVCLPLTVLAAPGTIYIDTGGAATNSGTTDNNGSVISGTAAAWTTGTAIITLDTNTNFATVPGCAAGTCDGSQAIFLTNATNSFQKIFWLASYTGCTGTGACVLTVTQNATCTTCTAQNWAIGGRTTLVGANYESALRPADTVQFNNNQTVAGNVFSSRVSGTNAGFITVRGKTGSRPVLTSSANAATISVGNNGAWYITNLELKCASCTGGQAPLSGVGPGSVIDNVKVSSSGGTGIISGNTGFTVINSEITGVVTGISQSGSNNYFANNYIHAVSGDCISLSPTSGLAFIIGNILSGCGAVGIDLSGASSSISSNLTVIEGNTIYAAVGNGLTVVDIDTSVRLLNNIFYRNDSTAAFNIAWSAGTGESASLHQCNVIFNAGNPAQNVSNYTLNGTEYATDPLLTTPGSGDFSISSSSPAANAGCLQSILGTTSTNYLDIGAVQRVHTPPAGGGGFIIGG